VYKRQEILCAAGYGNKKATPNRNGVDSFRTKKEALLVVGAEPHVVSNQSRSRLQFKVELVRQTSRSFQGVALCLLKRRKSPALNRVFKLISVNGYLLDDDGGSEDRTVSEVASGRTVVRSGQRRCGVTRIDVSAS